MLSNQWNCLLFWLITFEKYGYNVAGQGFWSKSNESDSSSNNNWFFRCGNPLMTEGMLVRLAIQLQELKKYEAAIDCYNRAIRKNQSRAEYYRLRGKCYVEMREMDMAICDFRMMLVLDPVNKNDRVLLSRTLVDAGRFQAAVEEILVLDDTDEIVRLGDKLTAIEQFDEALLCYSSAIERNPRKVKYYAKRALLNKSINKLEEAIADFEKIVEMKPSDVQSKIELSEALAEAGRYEEAKNVVKYARSRTNMTSTDTARLERARYKIEEIKNNRRLNELLEYLKTLLLRDAERQINRIMWESFANDGNEETRRSVRNIEWERDIRVNKLTRVFVEHKTQLSAFEFKRKKKTFMSSLFPRRFYKAIKYFCCANLDEAIAESCEIPDHLTDKISYELMIDPVITPSGITYERASILRHLQNHETDPMTNRRLSENNLIPNRAIKEAIESWIRRENEYWKPTKSSSLRIFN